VGMYTTADNNLAADRTDILGLIRHNRAGLSSLRDDHLTILGSIRAEETDGESRENRQGLEERITAVSESLQQLEVGVAESGVMLSLAHHFDTLEAERCIGRLEMRRVKDENDWLREELEDTEKKLEDALCRLTQLEEEKKQWEFMEEIRKSEKETNLKPVTPSKIPVGNFRVEEEKAINRALNGATDSNRTTTTAPPPVVSKIPKFFGSNYRKVQENIEKASNERSEAAKKLRVKSHKLSLTPASSHCPLPSR